MNAFAFDNTHSDSLNNNNNCFHVFNTEPTSVLDSTRSPLSSTTMSSFDEWETVQSQQHSILKLLRGDFVQDSAFVMQNGGGFLFDQSFSFNGVGSCSLPAGDFPFNVGNGCDGNVDPLLPFSSCGGFDSRVVVDQSGARFSPSQAVFLPVLDAQLGEDVLAPPSKRLNSGGVGMNCEVRDGGFSGCGGMGDGVFVKQDQQQLQLSQVMPHFQLRGVENGVPGKQKMVASSGDELGDHQLIVGQLFKVAENIETGNSVLAQEILARLNQQILPIGKAFHRAAYYFKEALEMILHLNKKSSSPLSHFDVIFKIAAYKSFSEVSPVVQFANLTCNQAILEAVEGFGKIHVVDFDIGYGGQWSSLMQELALRKGGAPILKITAFSSHLSHDHLELGFTRQCLIDFAQEINIPFELEIVNLESLNEASWPLPIHLSVGEAIAVNLPVTSFSKFPLPLSVLLRFVKQLSPKIMVSLDQGCERTEFRFPNVIIHALQSYSGLLESLDAVNVNPDALQKIERFLLQPSIENLVQGHQRYHEITHPWRSLLLSSGFSPIKFSNFAETQAECLLQRTQARGFQIAKRQASLVLSWQRKELISASAWKC